MELLLSASLVAAFIAGVALSLFGRGNFEIINYQEAPEQTTKVDRR